MRDELVKYLKWSIEKNGADNEASHSHAEKLLIAYLAESDPELSELWKEAQNDWWYA